MTASGRAGGAGNNGPVRSHKPVRHPPARAVAADDPRGVLAAHLRSRSLVPKLTALERDLKRYLAYYNFARAHTGLMTF